ncbi:hypothetical protein [Kurthia massiliensis]|nr:hypothetical protein [Kurthia massiliensis]
MYQSNIYFIIGIICAALSPLPAWAKISLIIVFSFYLLKTIMPIAQKKE